MIVARFGSKSPRGGFLRPFYVDFMTFYDSFVASGSDMSSFLEVLLRFDHLQRLILDPYGNNVVRAVIQCGACVQQLGVKAL